MTIPPDEAALAYLQQIQPRSLDELMAHVQRDLLALLDTYTSTSDQFETHIKTGQLSDDIAAAYQSGIRDGIDKSHLVLDELFRELQSIDAGLIQNWIGAFLHDVRAPISILKGWTQLLGDDLKALPTSPILKRVEQLNQEIQSTAEQMSTIIHACDNYARRLGDKK